MHSIKDHLLPNYIILFHLISNYYALNQNHSFQSLLPWEESPREIRPQDQGNLRWIWEVRTVLSKLAQFKLVSDNAVPSHWVLKKRPNTTQKLGAGRTGTGAAFVTGAVLLPGQWPCRGRAGPGGTP